MNNEKQIKLDHADRMRRGGLSGRTARVAWKSKSRHVA